MKTLFTFLMAFFALTAFAQETTTAHSDSISFTYMLDETWVPGYAQRFSTTAYLNFLQVEKGTVRLYFVARNHSRVMYGDATDFKTSQKEGQTISEFIIRSKRQNKGKMMNVEIIKDIDGNTKVRIYSDSARYDRFFTVHDANEKELSLIEEFWQDE